MDRVGISNPETRSLPVPTDFFARLISCDIMHLSTAPCKIRGSPEEHDIKLYVQPDPDPNPGHNHALQLSRAVQEWFGATSSYLE